MSANFAAYQPDTAAETSLQELDIPEEIQLLTRNEYSEEVIEEIDQITDWLENRLHLRDRGNF